MTAEAITLPAVEIDGDPAAVYRLFDADGILLYIGVTRNIAARFAKHEGEKPWWPDVARKTMTWYGSRDEALAVETAAIDAEAPVHNIIGQRKEKQPVPGRRPGRPKVGIQTCFTVPAYDLGVIDQIAQREGVARSALLRGVIAAYVADTAATETTGEPS